MNNEKILLAHGSGGKLMHELIERLFQNKFANEILDELNDSAIIDIEYSNYNNSYLCFTTDSYVVNPIFFPGGDIGKLAVCGTLNDLAVTGARPFYISCGFIVEEGLDYEILERITESMYQVVKREGVEIVTGDTKVVEKNSADKIFINTSGIGFKNGQVNFSKKRIIPGDKIIINGSIGEHGIAILTARGEFNLKNEIISDCATLTSLIKKILHRSKNIKFMRDPTRGGLATTLNEIVNQMDFGISIREEDIPIKEEVRSICELLGFDPLYIANEGKVVIVVSSEDAEIILQEMRKDPLGKDSQIIGEIIDNPKQKVIMQTKVQGSRIVDMLVGDQLPRIC
ncbi:MAG: hydrogenase expression/formation protein HypE [Deltaproteobacteria bacterium]|nr:MAG: hydrogenase expression/formation protein HypE [Deltaproteobacteria bacterium]